MKYILIQRRKRFTTSFEIKNSTASGYHPLAVLFSNFINLLVRPLNLYPTTYFCSLYSSPILLLEHILKGQVSSKAGNSSLEFPYLNLWLKA